MNFSVVSAGRKGTLKLTDFGFAKEAHARDTLKTPCYTPYYVGESSFIVSKLSKILKLWKFFLTLSFQLQRCWDQRSMTCPVTSGPLVSSSIYCK